MPHGFATRPLQNNGVLLILIALPFAVAIAPLAIYAISLSLFGLAHIVYELRYVDGRFSGHLRAVPLRIIVGLALLLLVVRVVFLTTAVAPSLQATFSIGLLAMFCASAMVPLWRQPRLHVLAVGFATFVVAAGAWWIPIESLAIFSLIHNITPIGFLVEAAPHGKRRRALVAALAIFLGLPLIAATGIAELVVASLHSSSFDALLGWSATISNHRSVFVPPQVEMPYSERIFAAGVTAQLLHYFATIVWLPRLGLRNRDRGHRLPWPTPRVVLLSTVVVSALLALGFFASFADARALYAIPAALHAWIEVPLLALGLSTLIHTRATRLSPSLSLS